jgi:hypothetical protein
LPPVLGYTSAAPFSAPIETAGTIYHTGVCVTFLYEHLYFNDLTYFLRLSLRSLLI